MSDTVDFLANEEGSNAGSIRPIIQNINVDDNVHSENVDELVDTTRDANYSDTLVGLVQDSEEEYDSEEESTPSQPLYTKTTKADVKCHVQLGQYDAKCCVKDCPTNYKDDKHNVTFITFPKGSARCRRWLMAIHREDLLLLVGKKESDNFLICSKHFTKDMWVDSDNKQKRLLKTAVPRAKIVEDISYDYTAPSQSFVRRKILPKVLSNESAGIKVKKVTALLSDSALRDTYSLVSSLGKPLSQMVNIRPVQPSSTNWPTILGHKEITTELEKKLAAENKELKSELDKNMDYILNQKSHYDALLSKEKERYQMLTDKIEVLEAQHRKLAKNFEIQLNAQKNTPDLDQSNRTLREKLKNVIATNADHEKKLIDAIATVSSLSGENEELNTKLNELSETASHPLTPEALVRGENFNAVLKSYLKAHTNMKNKIEFLTEKLDQESALGEKSHLLSLAAKYLNHGQLAWLEAQLCSDPKKANYPAHFKEFCIAFYDKFEYAYKCCQTVMGFAPVNIVKQWQKDPKSELGSVDSTINALFEECEPLPSGCSFQTVVLHEEELTHLADGNGAPFIQINENKLDRQSRKRRKCNFETESEEESYYDDDSDEGKLSDNDYDMLLYSSESEDEPEPKISNGSTEQPVYVQMRQSGAQETNHLIAVSAAPTADSSHPEFDFMMDDSSQTASIQIGNSMPIIVPDSGIAPGRAWKKKIPDQVVPP